jgi:hypothetical protein
MHYLALATDYDGTIADDGVVDQPTLAALERLRDGARRLILVTGRDLTSVQRIMPRLDICDLVVAENGALLTTSTKPHHVQENLKISALPEDAMQEIRDCIMTNVRFNSVVSTGVPGFIPRTGHASSEVA